jgi:hypothetical protein
LDLGFWILDFGFWILKSEIRNQKSEIGNAIPLFDQTHDNAKCRSKHIRDPLAQTKPRFHNENL